VYHRVESKELAFDITANTFITRSINYHLTDQKGLPFSAWLFRIAFNEIQQHYEKQKLKVF